MEAVCFKCGVRKGKPFNACPSCGISPMSASDRTVSLAMSSHIASDAQITQYGAEVAAGAKPSIPMGALSKAIDGLKSGLGSGEEASASYEATVDSTAATNRMGALSDSTKQTSDGEPKLERYGISLDQVPFALLDATPRDNRQRIIELAEERSLELDPAACQKARSDLTNPRTRLAAELAWFPGLSPGKIAKCLSTLHHDRVSICDESNLPALAHLNLMTYALELARDHSSKDDLAPFFCEIAELAEKLDAGSAMRDINEDRSVAGFPPLQSLEQVETGLKERKRCYRQVMKEALNRLPSDSLVRALTEAVETSTSSGETPAPALIDDLVDSYAVEVQSILDTGAERIAKLVEGVKTSVGRDPTAVDAKIALLETAARKWDAIAQPIQLCAKARGTDHDTSRRVAYEVRGLAIDLFNNHDLLAQSQRLTTLLQEIFAELPEVVELADKDAGDLEAIAKRRTDADAFEPIRARCEQAFANADRNPLAAHLEGQQLLRDGLALLKAVSVDPGSPAYKDAKDLLAAALMHCAVEYGNKASNWAACEVLLDRALELATDAKLREKIGENLATVKSNHANLGGCEPINRAPSLHTINGIGFTIYGRSDPKSDGSHMGTYYFVFFGIPVFPIARYRVIPLSGGYRFLGKGRLRTFDKWHLGIALVLVGWMVLAAMA